MSEKRFGIVIPNINEDDECYELVDKEERYSFYDTQDEWFADQVCHLLNELSDENRQLRTQVWLNEQEATIQSLQEEIKRLEKMIWKIQDGVERSD